MVISISDPAARDGQLAKNNTFLSWLKKKANLGSWYDFYEFYMHMRVAIAAAKLQLKILMDLI